jgi:hypothetical protein
MAIWSGTAKNAKLVESHAKSSARESLFMTGKDSWTPVRPLLSYCYDARSRMEDAV